MFETVITAINGILMTGVNITACGHANIGDDRQDSIKSNSNSNK